MEIRNVPYAKWRYWRDDRAIAGWTTQPDKDGYYHYFYCKPVGTGARKGKPTTFEYVPRLDGRRRQRVACRKIAYKMVFGHDYEPPKEKPAKTPNPPGTGYCMAEKKRVVIKDPQVIEAKNGRKMIQGKCPDCGCKIQKYGKIIDCPECGQHREAKADDYICAWCRIEA